MSYMPSISANTAPGKYHSSQYTPTTMGIVGADVFHYNNKTICVL